MGDPFFFEHDGARLFGVLEPAQAPSRNVGIVLCHPFGEEKQFTDRILVRFSRTLAAAGFAVLRFDNRGYGESSGDLQDAALETQVSETLGAAALLRARTAVSSIVFLGLRWGGTVAALAAERDPGVSALVLWSPILSGRAYGRELLRKKLAGQLALQDGTATREQIIDTLRSDGRIEFDGGYLTQRMFDDVAAIDLAQQVAKYERAVFVSTIRQRSENYGPYDALVGAYRAAGAVADFAPVEEKEYWDVRAMFDGLFPDQLFTATLDWLQPRWPVAA